MSRVFGLTAMVSLPSSGPPEVLESPTSGLAFPEPSPRGMLEHYAILSKVFVLLRSVRFVFSGLVAHGASEGSISYCSGPETAGLKFDSKFSNRLDDCWLVSRLVLRVWRVLCD